VYCDKDEEKNLIDYCDCSIIATKFYVAKKCLFHGGEVLWRDERNNQDKFYTSWLYQEMLKQDAHIDTVDVGLSQSVLIYILEFFLWFKYKDYHNTKVRFHL